MHFKTFHAFSFPQLTIRPFFSDVPQLVLRLGSKLRHFRIQEGNDVYMECDIRANPWVTEISWTFEGRELHTNVSAGLIISNQSLVLQRVQRTNRGHYTCSASNSEGMGESKPLYLSIQCKPYSNFITSA